jgi:hypothetical protein
VLSSANGDGASPEVAISPSGQMAVAVWVLETPGESVLQSRWYTNGTWGPLTQIGVDTMVGDPEVDITDDGRTALVVWRDGTAADRVIRVAWGQDGAWDSPDGLTVAGTDSVTPDIDLAGDGTRAIATWRRYAGGFYNVESTQWSGTTWSPPQWLSASAQTAPAHVALTDSGAVAAWTEVRGGAYRVVAARRSAGQWTQAEALSAAGSNSYDPVLATEGDSAGLAWSRDVAGTRVVETSVDRGAGWTTAQAVSRAGESSYDPHLAMSADGSSAIAVWTVALGLQRKVSGARYEGGTWGTPVDVSSAGPLAGNPVVRVDPQAASGRAFWRGRDGNFALLRTARLVDTPEVVDTPAANQAKPAAVSGLTVRVKKRQVRVSWRPPAGATTFRVVLRKRGAAKPRVRTVTGRRTTFSVSNGRFRVAVAGQGPAGRGPVVAKTFRVPRR